MKFSVIVPIYNAEKYIHESVSSVLNQTYKNFEIVLIDDGSTDRSASICDALAENHDVVIKVIHQTNKGQLLSRYKGVDVSTGDYCIFLDADDLLLPNCLERLCKAIKDFSEPDIIVYNFERLSLLGEKICKPIPLESNFIYADEQKIHIYELLLSSSWLNSMWNKCIKRECMMGCGEKFLGYQSLRCGEDRLQVLESVTSAKNIIYIEDVLYCYRLFGGSVTRNLDVSLISKFNMKILYELEYEYLSKWNLNLEEWQNELKARFLNETIYTFSNFYKNAKSKRDRKLIVDYMWDDFLPENFWVGASTAFAVNAIKLYEKIKEKKYLWIRLYYFKNTFREKFRGIKRKIKK